MSAGLRQVASELSAQERLSQSRESMSRWLTNQTPGNAATANPDPAQSPGSTTGLRSLFASPVALICLDLLTQWWAELPLLKSVHQAEEAAHEAIAPLVRRHPVAVLGAAAAAGALLVWYRPWRLLPGPAKLGSIASSIALGAVSRMALQRKDDSSHADSSRDDL